MLDHSCQVQRHAHTERGHDRRNAIGRRRGTSACSGVAEGRFWEPAYGRGAIANVLRAHGHHVVCTDLVDYGADPTAIYGVDFLRTTKVPDDVDCIVTNPPVKLINDFIGSRAPALLARRHAVASGTVGIGTTVVGLGRTGA